jgi:hypothetical protein
LVGLGVGGGGGGRSSSSLLSSSSSSCRRLHPTIPRRWSGPCHCRQLHRLPRPRLWVRWRRPPLHRRRSDRVWWRRSPQPSPPTPHRPVPRRSPRRGPAAPAALRTCLCSWPAQAVSPRRLVTVREALAATSCGMYNTNTHRVARCGPQMCISKTQMGTCDGVPQTRCSMVSVGGRA